MSAWPSPTEPPPGRRPPDRSRTILYALAALLVYLAIRKQVLTSTSLLFFLALVPSVILHEVSHGAVAYLFGDDTAQRAGRLSLNPIRHVDLFGTIILPALLVLTAGVGFGYAKPVPVNVRRLRNPRDQGLVVALVGPAVNIVIAALSGLALRVVAPAGTIPPAGFLPQPMGWRFVYLLGLANVILAAFNLIPIPPLDGSAVVERLLPRAWWPRYLQFRRYSIFLLLFILLAVPQIRNGAFDRAIRLWTHLLGTGTTL
ncbi:MAG TPA: site-2 protease family protein [Acidimicrobiales bacterium]|nr:site-2 protease family protein [Acidimicrobiales bacterium]